MNDKLFIKTCPICGSDKIQLVVKDVIRKYKDQTYTVPAVEFYECSNCGEKVYDRAAIQKIEAYSPAYRHEHSLAEA
ncbi:MAG: YgiT-type zinc finger protein [Anaerolineales bacterium]|jgi:YgiT-type zinc finger domain-containing protein|nr:YgiT-type zinc finger protein [Anaerolineales bacterium]